MVHIDTLKLPELKELLVGLKTYQDMKKKLGKRGEKLFHSELHETSTFVVEYFPSLSEDAVWEQAQSVYKKAFDVTPKKEDVIFIKKDALSGGMVVYKNDTAIDMSFRKVERLLKK